MAKDITDILKKTANMASESRVTKVAEEFDQRLTSKADVDKVLEKVVVVEVAAGVKTLVESKTAVDKIVKDMERRPRSESEADQVLRNADITEVVAGVKTLLESKKAVDRVINELERRLNSEEDADKVPEKADIAEVAAGVKSLLRSKTDIDNSTRELRGLIEANAFIGEAAKDLKEMIDSLETDDPAPRRAQIGASWYMKSGVKISQQRIPERLPGPTTPRSSRNHPANKGMPRTPLSIEQTADEDLYSASPRKSRATQHKRILSNPEVSGSPRSQSRLEPKRQRFDQDNRNTLPALAKQTFINDPLRPAAGQKKSMAKPLPIAEEESGHVKDIFGSNHSD